MIRHAESSFVFGKERTRGLSEQGKLDAQKVVELMSDEPIDIIVSSPYTRAVQTIQGLADLKHLPVKEYEGLRERALKGPEYNISEQRFWEEAKKSFEDQEYCMPGGESIKQAQERAVPIIKRLLKEYEGKRIVVGTHGNIMTIIMNDFDDCYGYDFWKNTSKPDIYKLIFNGDQLTEVKRIWSYNSSGGS